MNQKAFTLIELLVVIAIVGLLSSVVLVSTRGLRGQAKLTKALEFSHSVQHTLGAYAVGWWSFEDSATDSSGYGNNGTWYGSGTHYVDNDIPQFGRTAQFNGTDDYVNCGSGSSLDINGSITVGAWVYWITGSGEEVIYNNGASETGGVLLQTRNSNNLRFLYNFNNNYWLNDNQGNAFSSNQWYHIVGTFDDTTTILRVYINGKLEAEDASGDVGARTTGSSIIGKASWYDSRYFNGLIDEVRIYERALTTGEIQQHYAEGLEKYQNLANGYREIRFPEYR